MNLGSRTEVVTISFTFSGSAFGLIGFDIHAASTNSVIVRPHRTPDNGLYFVTYQGRVTQNLCKNR
jgi:hypothetical protein